MVIAAMAVAADGVAGDGTPEDGSTEDGAEAEAAEAEAAPGGSPRAEEASFRASVRRVLRLEVAPLVPLVSPLLRLSLLLRLSPLLRRSLSPPPLFRTAPELWRLTFWDAPTAGDARGEVVLARRSAKRDGLDEDDSGAAAWRVSPSSSKASEWCIPEACRSRMRLR